MAAGGGGGGASVAVAGGEVGATLAVVVAVGVADGVGEAVPVAVGDTVAVVAGVGVADGVGAGGGGLPRTARRAARSRPSSVRPSTRTLPPGQGVPATVVSALRLARIPATSQ